MVEPGQFRDRRQITDLVVLKVETCEAVEIGQRGEIFNRILCQIQSLDPCKVLKRRDVSDPCPCQIQFLDRGGVFVGHSAVKVQITADGIPKIVVAPLDRIGHGPGDCLGSVCLCCRAVSLCPGDICLCSGAVCFRFVVDVFGLCLLCSFFFTAFRGSAGRNHL